MLPKAHRLTRSGDYARIRREGRSKAHPLLILATAPNGGAVTRVGFTVGNKIGKAVARNRAKRLLREAARARLSDLPPGYDIVLIARQGLTEATLPEITTVMNGLLRRVNLLDAHRHYGGDAGNIVP